MIAVAMLGEDEEELQQIKKTVKKCAAELTDEQWQFGLFVSVAKFRQHTGTGTLVDIGCIDFDATGAADAAYRFRQSHGDAMLLLLADTAVSPTAYLKPGIRADSLVLKPLTDGKLEPAIHELVSSYLDRRQGNDSEGSCIIKEGQEKWRIPYRDIYYFESKEKRVFVRTLRDEFAWYETMEHLEETLPTGFLRCHRSFIINSSKLKRVHLSHGYLELADGFQIPLSRTYKKRIRQWQETEG